MWWFTLSLLLLVLFFSSSFRSQTQAFDHFRSVTCFSCWSAVCEHATPHAGERLVQKENKTCSDFVAQLRFFFFLFFLTSPRDVRTVRKCFFSQSFRHYYKLQGFESSVRLSGFSFFILLWKLGFLWHPGRRHKLILMRMYCMCVKWQSVSALSLGLIWLFVIM